MKQTQEKINRYSYAYWGYLLSSFMTFVAFLISLWASYLTEFQEMVTISHLFLLLFLLGITAYLRINALHYHKLILQLKEALKAQNSQVSKRMRPTSRARPREEQSHYER